MEKVETYFIKYRSFFFIIYRTESLQDNREFYLNVDYSVTISYQGFAELNSMMYYVCLVMDPQKGGHHGIPSRLGRSLFAWTTVICVGISTTSKKEFSLSLQVQ